MIITRKYAKRLLKDISMVQELGLVAHCGRYYVAILRDDIQRIDHYIATDQEIRRLDWH